MARLLVVPIEQKDIAVWPVTEIDEPGPSVVGQQEIVAMRRHVTGTSFVQQIDV